MNVSQHLPLVGWQNIIRCQTYTPMIGGVVCIDGDPKGIWRIAADLRCVYVSHQRSQSSNQPLSYGCLVHILCLRVDQANTNRLGMFDELTEMNSLPQSMYIS